MIFPRAGVMQNIVFSLKSAGYTVTVILHICSIADAVCDKKKIYVIRKHIENYLSENYLFEFPVSFFSEVFFLVVRLGLFFC